MKLNILKTFTLILFFMSLFVACEDEPTSLGIENIPPEDLLGLFELNSLETPINQTITTYDASYVDTTWNLGTSIRLYFGKKEDIISKMLIVFRSNVADSIATAFDENQITIQKAWVELRPKSLLGDSSAAFDFTVSKIKTNWTSSLFNLDSLSKVLPHLENIQISLIENNDSLIKFDIPTELANEWFEGSVKDSTELNNGLLFEPSAGASKILGFYSLHEDNIAIGYENIPVAKIEIKKTGWSSPDTLLFYSFRDVHVLTEGYPQDNSNVFFLQGGIPKRGNYYIDVSAIPENSIIVNAKLEFYFDRALTLDGNPSSNTLNMIMYDDSTSRQLLTGTRLLTLKKDSVEDKYSGDITSFVQLWNQGEDNQGMFIHLINENYTLNRIAFYSPRNFNPALRPKLTIKYSKK